MRNEGLSPAVDERLRRAALSIAKSPKVVTAAIVSVVVRPTWAILTTGTILC